MSLEIPMERATCLHVLYHELPWLCSATLAAVCMDVQCVSAAAQLGQQPGDQYCRQQKGAILQHHEPDIVELSKWVYSSQAQRHRVLQTWVGAPTVARIAVFHLSEHGKTWGPTATSLQDLGSRSHRSYLRGLSPGPWTLAPTAIHKNFLNLPSIFCTGCGALDAYWSSFWLMPGIRS